MKRLVLMMAPFLLCQCSSMERSVGLGAGIGAAGGVAAGYAANFNMKGMALTTTTGALMGAFIGYLAHKRSDDGNAALASVPGVSVQSPFLRDADTESIWIPDRIEDSRYIQGHWIHEIRNPSTWALTEKEKEGGENGIKRKEKQERRAPNSAQRKLQEDSRRVEE